MGEWVTNSRALSNDESLIDPVSYILRTDLRQDRLQEATIEKAFVFELLKTGKYQIDGTEETVELLAEQGIEVKRVTQDTICPSGFGAGCLQIKPYYS